MISTSWIEKREPYWRRLESLVGSASRGVGSLSHAELQELGLLYRQTAADLAAVREDPTGLQFARYLNQLMARAHHIIYAGHRASPWGVVGFFCREYPRVFRRNRTYCLVALAVFVVGALSGAALTFEDPDFEQQVLPPQLIHSIEHKQMWTHSIVSVKPHASSRIMTNNLTVAFMAYASGIAAGLGTLAEMFFNGLLTGVIGAACALAGMNLSLWSFVAPHGALELPSIFLAGGAGLKMAHGLLFPGTLPRKDSLAIAGREATSLVLGTVPLLILAGMIEAFVSPTGLQVSLKFAMSGALLVLLTVYLFGAGRERSPDTRQPFSSSLR
ncbi:MAG: stage II sporulation protein M [Acidobacteria bacterium]|nr:stage II sporulation protein M [Acidobacteriota bacterium]MBV9622680.1 stage II sporulation protein M [Acidobacteriota bacterium]